MTKRILNLNAGRLMVVTDLHGDYPIYCRYRDCFLALHAGGQADTLLFCGDLIHGPAEKDGSLEIVLDVLRLQHELGQNLIVLLGNHEMPHLYSVTISKGDAVYTPHFESAMGAHRKEIIAFFNSFPFYVRTRAGVTITHAGASQSVADPNGFKILADYSHTDELALVDILFEGQDMNALRTELAKLNGYMSYDEMVVDNLGEDGLVKDRYDDLLRGAYVSSMSDGFQKLWDALFNANESAYGPIRYTTYVKDFLKNLSKGYTTQHSLVSGHITLKGGHTIIANSQLRLASWEHATPREAGQYLLFDASKPIDWVGDLERGLGSVFK